jgi:uncharacterized peroxidase-related enzyme
MNARISLEPTNQNPQVTATLGTIKSAFGTIPNMFKAVSNSPAALQSMWGSFAALGGGSIGAKLGEQLAVAIANTNRCDYCLAAHTALGKNAGVSAEHMQAAQRGVSNDAKTQTALNFAIKVVKNRAQISTQDVTDLRTAGFNDEAIVEIMAHIALNVFTNYVNVAFDVPVDFERVALTA